MTLAQQPSLSPSKPKWVCVGPDGITYDLHNGQIRVLKSRARFTAAIAGTGGGKTCVGPLWIAKQIAATPAGKPILGMALAPTYQIMSRATAPALVETFRGTDLEGEYVESKKQYRLPGNRGIIWTLSADNPEGIEGGQYDFAWLDEAGQLTYSAWVAIQGRTGLNRAPVLITTTPYSMNWLKHEVVDRAVKGDPDYAVFTWDSIANPAYPKEEFERARKTLRPSTFDRRYRGRFTQAEGLVYPDFAFAVVPPPVELPAGQLVGGIDFGFSSPFAALAGVQYIDEADGLDKLLIFYERYKSRCLLHEHVAALPADVTWHADPSRPDDIVELRRAGLSIRAANNKIELGIDAVTRRILEGRLKVSSACRAVIAEAAAYSYKSADGLQISEDVAPGMDHACDALRYLVMSVDRRKVAA